MNHILKNASGMNSIKKYLPEKKDKKLLQARVEAELRDKLVAKLKKEDVGINEFFEAAIKAYLAEK